MTAFVLVSRIIIGLVESKRPQRPGIDHVMFEFVELLSYTPAEADTKYLYFIRLDVPLFWNQNKAYFGLPKSRFLISPSDAEP